jgi:hypothetical protein
MPYEKVACEDRCAQPSGNAGRAVDVSLAADELVRVAVAISDGHAWGVSRDGRTRVWVELVCWPPSRAPVVA